MTVNPICILRGLCNSIQGWLFYDISGWVNPKISSGGYFTIYLPHQEGSGHEDIDILAEAIIRFEEDNGLPYGTYGLRFFARTTERLSSCFEFYGPLSPDVRKLSKYIDDARKEWGHGILGDEFSWVNEEGEEYNDIPNWKYVVDVEDVSSVEPAEYTIQTRLEV